MFALKIKLKHFGPVEGRTNLPFVCYIFNTKKKLGERGGSVVECRTPEREVGGSIPTAAVLCP